MRTLIFRLIHSTTTPSISRLNARAMVMNGRHNLSTDSKRVNENLKVEEAKTINVIPPSTEKLLVLGGNGFVGSHICREALDCGLPVASLSRSGRSSLHDSWANNVTWYKGDLLYTDSWKEALNGVSAVISCIGGFGSNPYMYRINGTANINAIRAASEQGVKRFIFISAADFGLANYFLQGYYEGKRAAETELLTRLPYGGVILRPGFIYGTRGVGTMKIPLGVIGSPLEMVLQHARPLKNIPVVGPLLTPPINVTDVANAAVRAATDPVFPPGIIEVFGIQPVDLINNVKVKAIIGPQCSRQASFLINVGKKCHIPIISFSATSPSLTSPYFFRVAQNDTTQIQAILAIVQAFGWNQVVPIYSQGIYEEEIIPSMARAFQEANVQVPYQSAIPPKSKDQNIFLELQKLKNMSTRVFVVHLSPKLGSHLFFIAKELGMMSKGYVWIMTTKMSNLLSSLNSSSIDSMQGVLGVSSYFPKTKELEDFEVRWKMKFLKENPLIQMNVLGLWAYDATIALAMAIEKVGATKFSSLLDTSTSRNNATNFEDVGVSQIGPRLGETLSKTKFKGLIGEFSFANGEVKLPNFQIINLVGDGKRVVGYWTPQKGLKREMETTTNDNNDTYSISKANLGPIIWPGDSSSAPTGLDELANMKVLRVGVPLKGNIGFNEFVSVEIDPNTHAARVKGYCIDVFKSVLEELPYNVTYEFIPFSMHYDKFSPDINYFTPDQNYHDLIQLVNLRQIDVVVADVTIMARRFLYADFTMPYTEGGAVFIVPVTKEKNKTKAWIFLKPLTWELWLTTGCFFVFIGFVVWVLEHQVNEEFRGSPSHQVSTSFWFSFSTLVFAQRERVRSNLARFVVIIWVFVVLILTQSYTANLATQMTVQQLTPTVTNVYQLLQNRDSVGYQNGSFTYKFLRQLGFDDTQLKAYNNAQECDHLFQLGTQNGGIAAAFDEIPYTKIIIASYCSKYTTIQPTYRTGGFGFAFKRGSPLVQDFSRAILNLSEENQDILKAIEDKWFKNVTDCLQSSSSSEDGSYSLDFDSFKGLFLVAGLASLSALTIHTSTFLYGHRSVFFMQFYSNVSLWRKICAIFRLIFDQQDISNVIINGSENHDREQNSRDSNRIHHVEIEGPT